MQLLLCCWNRPSIGCSSLLGSMLQKHAHVYTPAWYVRMKFVLNFLHSQHKNVRAVHSGMYGTSPAQRSFQHYSMKLHSLLPFSLGAPLLFKMVVVTSYPAALLLSQSSGDTWENAVFDMMKVAVLVQKTPCVVIQYRFAVFHKKRATLHPFAALKMIYIPVEGLWVSTGSAVSHNRKQPCS